MRLMDLTETDNGQYNELQIKGVSCSSSNVKEGDAFVCIKGTALDGHDFARAALDAGAAVVIAQRDTGVEKQIIVEDSRAMYAKMCANYFGNPARSLKIIGVTGTNGKTTITYLLKSILEAAGHKTGVIGTIQNMIGDSILPAKNTTPDAYELHSLFSLMDKAGCEYVVMEVSSHALDQKRVDGIRFAVGIFTNLTQDHLDYHKSIENYMEAKRKLFTMCDKAIINADDPYGAKMAQGLSCETILYSTMDDTSDFIAREVKYKADGVTFDLLGKGVIGRVRFKTPGKFSVYNAMAAGVAAISIGLPFDGTVQSLSLANGVKGRAEVVPSGRDFTVIIDYAHTPDALTNVLNMLNQVKLGRLVTLFGCGGDRDKTKRPIMGEIAAKNSDFVIVTSDNPRTEEPSAIIEDILSGMKEAETPYIIIENRVNAIDYAIENAKTDDIILLAGKGHETYQILKHETIRLDEREVVAEALKKLN